jgi:hypothetical protein
VQGLEELDIHMEGPSEGEGKDPMNEMSEEEENLEKPPILLVMETLSPSSTKKIASRKKGRRTRTQALKEHGKNLLSSVPNIIKMERLHPWKEI